MRTRLELLASFLAATAAADTGYDLGLQNVVVERNRSPEVSVTFEVVNRGQEPHRFWVRAYQSRGGAPDLALPSSAGQELAPGGSVRFTIPSRDLREGWNVLGLELVQDGTGRGGGTYAEYLKQVPGGLPDLKIVRSRRLSAGTYAFTVKNVGRADALAFSVGYSVDSIGAPRRTFVASPDPAPALSPGQSFEFVLRDLPENVPNPKKDRFNLLIDVDPENRIAETNEDNNHRTTGYGYNGSWAENHP